MSGFLVINPRAGTERPSAEELVKAAEKQGIRTHVLREGEDAAELARAAADASALGMAGGDGSLGAVAAVALERDLPFVCIPFGTYNHFAWDAGIDRDDPPGALRAFAGEERRGARFTIEADAPSLDVAVDGEPVRLRPPVELRVEPRALRLQVPERGEDVDDGAEGELLRPG